MKTQATTELSLLPLVKLVTREDYHDKIEPDYEYFCNWSRNNETGEMLKEIQNQVDKVNNALLEAGCFYVPKEHIQKVYNDVNFELNYNKLENEFLWCHLFKLSVLGLRFKGERWDKYMLYKPYQEKFAFQLERENSSRGRGYGTYYDIKVGYKDATITSQSSMQQHSWSETNKYRLSLKNGWEKV
jgi:hypothetical protein